MWIELASIVVKAGIIVILIAIARSDFNTQKIRNQDLAYLLMASLALCAVRFAAGQSTWAVLLEAAAGAGLFAVLFLFWMLRKLGAGDVKLLAIVPLVVGMEGAMTFTVGLLALTTLTYALTKFPVLVPQRWFKNYLVGLGRTGRIPFGVPISAATAIALLLPLSFYQPPVTAPPRQLTTLDFGDLAAR
jgi:prepilin peptidase CpaA